MKSLFKSVILVVAIATSLTSMANESDVNIKMKALNSKLIQFTLNNSDGNIQVIVKDSDGYVFYTEDFSGSVYKKTYDLKSLPNGIYFIELNGETKIKKFPIKVKTNKVEFDASKTQVYHKALVSVEDKVVNITKLSLDLEPLKVEVFNADKELIHEEVLEGRMDLKRSLSLNKLSSGVYNLVLTTKEEVLAKTIKI